MNAQFLIVDNIHVIRWTLIESIIIQIAPEITPGLLRSDKHRGNERSIQCHQFDQRVWIINMSHRINSKQIIASIFLTLRTKQNEKYRFPNRWGNLHGLLTCFSFGDVIVSVEIFHELVTTLLEFRHVLLSEIFMIVSLHMSTTTFLSAWIEKTISLGYE